MKSITTQRWFRHTPRVSPFRKGAERKSPAFVPAKIKKS